jgi:hypothetical protein
MESRRAAEVPPLRVLTARTKRSVSADENSARPEFSTHGGVGHNTEADTMNKYDKPHVIAAALQALAARTETASSYGEG